MVIRTGPRIPDFELYLSKWKYAKSSVNKEKVSNNHKDFDQQSMQ